MPSVWHQCPTYGTNALRTKTDISSFPCRTLYLPILWSPISLHVSAFLGINWKCGCYKALKRYWQTRSITSFNFPMSPLESLDPLKCPPISNQYFLRHTTPDFVRFCGIKVILNGSGDTCSRWKIWTNSGEIPGEEKAWPHHISVLRPYHVHQVQSWVSE